MTPALSYEEVGSWSKKGEYNKWDGQKIKSAIIAVSVQIFEKSLLSMSLAELFHPKFTLLFSPHIVV